MNRHELWATGTVEARRSHIRLRNLLRLNAAFSAATGLIGVAAPETVARAVGIEPALAVRGIGGGLVLYAVDLVIAAAFRRRWLVRFGRGASVADAGWVLASGIAVATGAVSAAGALVLALLALPVGALAVAQWRAVSAIDPLDLGEGPPVPSAHLIP